MTLSLLGQTSLERCCEDEPIEDDIADTDKTAAALLDELATLDRRKRRKAAGELREVAGTFAEVPGGPPRRPHARAAGPTSRPELTGVAPFDKE